MITIFTCKFIFLILHAFYSDETSTTNNISNNESWEISKLFTREIKYILICTLLFFFKETTNYEFFYIFIRISFKIFISLLLSFKFHGNYTMR